MLWRIALIGGVLWVFIAASVHAQCRIAINEIMYAPAAPEPEWIELFNTDSVTAQLLTGWSVSSGTTAALPAAEIGPLGYIVLTKDSVTLRLKRAGAYQVVQIALPNLRNSGDTIVLRDASGMLQDSVGYLQSWGGKSGRSLERVDARWLGNDSSNWETSEDSSGSTIGAANSVRLTSHDLRITLAGIDDSSIVVKVRNAGSTTVLQPTVELVINNSDTLIRRSTVDLQSRESTEVRLQVPNTFYGVEPCTAFIIDSMDQRHSNDTVRFLISRPVPKDSVVINEIMFEPVSNSCEWIELFNRSERAVSLLQTSVNVGEKTVHRFLISDTMHIPPHSYAVIGADSTLYNTYSSLLSQQGVAVLNKTSLDLSNDSATIVFASFDSSTIDSVRYMGSWHTTENPIHIGRSLERVKADKSGNDSLNWQTSTDPLGATPLAQNSSKKAIDTVGPLAMKAEFSTNPFSPDGDGFEDETSLDVTSADELNYQLTVRLFDTRGRQIRTLVDGVNFKNQTSLPFDGKNDRGQVIGPGLYAALIQLFSQDPPKAISRTIGLVIAGKRK